MCSGQPEEMLTCSAEPCPVDCEWREWDQWTDCSKTCSVGKKTRSRSISIEARNRGKTCTGLAQESLACSVRTCPVDCFWEEWKQWDDCTKTCGHGLKTRSRGQTRVAQHGGLTCGGERREEKSCHTEPCPIDCAWFSWEFWHGCTKTCGDGQRVRFRQKKVEVSHGGKDCDGDKEDRQKCAAWQCPIDCQWGEWNEWLACTKSCGGGKRTRAREIEIPGQHGGLQCRGDKQVSRWCQTNPCPEDYRGRVPPAQLQTKEKDEDEGGRSLGAAGAAGAAGDGNRTDEVGVYGQSAGEGDEGLGGDGISKLLLVALIIVILVGGIMYWQQKQEEKRKLKELQDQLKEKQVAEEKQKEEDELKKKKKDMKQGAMSASQMREQQEAREDDVEGEMSDDDDKKLKKKKKEKAKEGWEAELEEDEEEEEWEEEQGTAGPH